MSGRKPTHDSISLEWKNPSRFMKNQGRSMGQGWEEAGGEFYQEFHGTLSSSDGDNQQVKKWETLLPSKRVNAIDARTWSQATARAMSVRTHVRRDSASAADLDIETMPDLAQGLANEEETWNQLQSIRTYPIDMASKRELKAKLMRTPKFRVHGLAALQLKRRQMWQRVCRLASQSFSHFILWRRSLRFIEANFGTGVASYFLLIRWLFLLNLTLGVIITFFILIPWELGQKGCPNIIKDESSCAEPLLAGCNRTIDASCETDESWILYSSSIQKYRENRTSPELLVQDTILGTGWMELTLAFYGYYQPALLQWGNYSYDVGLGYELTIFTALFLSLICMINSVTQGFRENISLGKNWLHRYSDLVFSSWDYCIDKSRVADLNKKAILYAMRAALADDAYFEEKLARTLRVKIRLFFLRLFVNVLVLLVLCVCGYVIFMVTQFSQNYTHSKESGAPCLTEDDPEYVIRLFIEFFPSIVITALNFGVPKLFKLFVGWERFSATFEIKVTLVRTVFLRLASLLVLIGTLFQSLKSDDVKTNLEDSNSCIPETGFDCWETRVGQQLYRLNVFDTSITAVSILLVRLPITLIFKKTNSSTSFLGYLAHPEFDLVSSTLDLVYSQAICWMGMIYCPILPIASALTFFIKYYLKYLNLVVCSSPPSRLYGASRSTALFMNVLLVSFITCVLPLGYHVTILKPSPSCGPYRGMETVWSLIAGEVSKLRSGKEILNFFGTAGFFLPLLLVLFIALYYYRAKASAQRELTNALKQQLILEGQDKQFLMNQLDSVAKTPTILN